MSTRRLRSDAAHRLVGEAHLVGQDPIEPDRPTVVGPAGPPGLGHRVPRRDDDVHRLVEQDLGAGVLDGGDVALFALAGDAARGVDAAGPELVGDDRVVLARERADRAVLDGRAVHRQVEAAEDHVLGRRHHRRAVGRRQQVRRRQHHGPRLFLRGVDSGTWTAIWSPSKSALNAVQQQVDLDRRALDEDRHERLDAQAVERRRFGRTGGPMTSSRTSQTSGGRARRALGALDVVGEALLDSWRITNGEQLERHLLGQAALVGLAPARRR